MSVKFDLDMASEQFGVDFNYHAPKNEGDKPYAFGYLCSYLLNNDYTYVDRQQNGDVSVMISGKWIKNQAYHNIILSAKQAEAIYRELHKIYG